MKSILLTFTVIIISATFSQLEGFPLFLFCTIHEPCDKSLFKSDLYPVNFQAFQMYAFVFPTWTLHLSCQIFSDDNQTMVISSEFFQVDRFYKLSAEICIIIPPEVFSMRFGLMKLKNGFLSAIEMLFHVLI